MLLLLLLISLLLLIIFLKTNEDVNESNLQLLLTVPFQGRIDHFSWSPKTNIATLNPVIEFAVCDNNGNLLMCYNELNKETMDLNQSSTNLKTNVSNNFFLRFNIF